jgi:phenylacetate-CoA ligase
MYNPDIETAPREKLLQLQRDRLRDQIAYAVQHVPFYRERFDEAGVEPDAIAIRDALTDLPFTTKADFRQEYPTGLFAVPMERILRIQASSGTTGKPKIVGYTEADLDLWANLTSRIVTMAGVGADDVVQNTYGYGLFTGGVGFHYGAETVGATVIPVSSGQTETQLELLQALESDALLSTPSYALYLAETAEEQDVPLSESSLSVALVGAESMTEPMRAEIESRLDVRVIDGYGLSEIIGPGVAAECPQQDGLHLWEDHFYPEIVDPETGERLPEGETGELVLTTLTKEALPMIRYRTGDITSLTREPCPCGRTHTRIDNITGRTDDLLIIRGVNVYPSQIEAVALEFDVVEPQYRLDIYREGTMDRLELTLELRESFSGDAEKLAERIERRLQNVLSLSPDSLELVSPETIERTEIGKAKRVYDHRN